MIQRETNGFVVECDECGELLETDLHEFYLVTEEMKQSGWSISKEQDGSWTHRCPSCFLEQKNPQNDFEV